MVGLQTRRWTPGRITLVAGVVLLWLCLGLLVWQRQAVADWLSLRDYTPPAEIAQLATDTTMTPLSKKLFYVYRAQIEPASSFNEHCPVNEQEFTIVLGCYVSKVGIYLFHVEDERLSGIEQVTAAHEMLHVAYERLGSRERERVDTMLVRAYDNLDNDRIMRNVEQYRAADPSVVPNELHSILGTEQADLPPELEEYYARYFTNRQKIVEYSQQYEGEFTRREQAAAQLSKQLSDLKPRVDANLSQLDSEAARLQAEYAAIEAGRDSMEASQLNERARAYNAAVAAYNTLAETTRAEIEQYNAIVEQYNAVVVEQHELYRAIDSSPEAIE